MQKGQLFILLFLITELIVFLCDKDVYLHYRVARRMQHKLFKTKDKALSLVFMKRRKGVFSFWKWRCIVDAKIKNNQLSSHSLGWNHV